MARIPIDRKPGRPRAAVPSIALTLKLQPPLVAQLDWLGAELGWGNSPIDVARMLLTAQLVRLREQGLAPLDGNEAGADL